MQGLGRDFCEVKRPCRRFAVVDTHLGLHPEGLHFHGWHALPSVWIPNAPIFSTPTTYPEWRVRASGGRGPESRGSSRPIPKGVSLPRRSLAAGATTRIWAIRRMELRTRGAVRHPPREAMSLRAKRPCCINPAKGGFGQASGVRTIEPSGLMERAMGIEPTSEAWEASILPLYDARSAL